MIYLKGLAAIVLVYIALIAIVNYAIIPFFEWFYNQKEISAQLLGGVIFLCVLTLIFG